MGINEIQEDESYCVAASPGIKGLHYSDIQWKFWLIEQFDQFEGNFDNAARLLKELAEGVKYIEEKIGKKLADRKCPKIYVSESGNKNNPAVIYLPESNAICLRLDFLGHRSGADMNKLYTFKSEYSGEPMFVGTYPQIFRLIGVEEAHHALYHQIKHPKETVPNLHQTVVEHDAEDIEFKARRWELRYALEHHYPQEGIEVLRRRIQAVLSARKKK